MKKQKAEFSKIIITAFGILAIIITAYTMAIVWKTEDLSPLEWLIPAIFAGLTTATGFYYSKAKAENQIKLRKKYGAEIFNDIKEDNTDG